MTATARPRLAHPSSRVSFDRKKYGRLLARTLPSVIDSEVEYIRVVAEIEGLLRKGDALAPEEDRLLDLLSVMVERFEDRSEGFPDSKPHRLLQFLMDQNDLRQADLVKVLGTRGRVSEIVNGKRTISKAQAKALGQFFKIAPEAFI